MQEGIAHQRRNEDAGPSYYSDDDADGEHLKRCMGLAAMQCCASISLPNRRTLLQLFGVDPES